MLIGVLVLAAMVYWQWPFLRSVMNGFVERTRDAGLLLGRESEGVIVADFPFGLILTGRMELPGDPATTATATLHAEGYPRFTLTVPVNTEIDQRTVFYVHSPIPGRSGPVCIALTTSGHDYVTSGVAEVREEGFVCEVHLGNPVVPITETEGGAWKRDDQEMRKDSLYPEGEIR